MPETDRTRLDRWLWYARFFKTRALAQQAVAGGKVHVAGARVKPGRALKVGDAVSIQRGEEQFDVTVAQLGTRRGPAAEAQRLYVESEASRARRARDAERRRLAAETRITRQGRPTKRDRRRQIRQFRDGLE